MATPRVEWSDQLLTGDRAIDTHHRALFLSVQRLVVACDLGRGDEHVEATLRFLAKYAVEHFAVEDERMDRLQYPYTETHRAAHRSFLNRLETLAQDIGRGVDKKRVAAAVAEFATDWFMRHVRLVDMPLIEYMRGSRS
jgi:hemerythrin